MKALRDADALIPSNESLNQKTYNLKIEKLQPVQCYESETSDLYRFAVGGVMSPVLIRGVSCERSMIRALMLSNMLYKKQLRAIMDRGKGSGNKLVSLLI